MLTYPKSTMRVRRMPMHLSSGHVTLMPGKFYPPSNFPQLDLGRRADSRLALPQISSSRYVTHRLRRLNWVCPHNKGAIVVRYPGNLPVTTAHGFFAGSGILRFHVGLYRI